LIDWIFLEILLCKTLTAHFFLITLLTALNETLDAHFLVVLSVSWLALALTIHWLFFTISIDIITLCAGMVAGGFAFEAFHLGVTELTLFGGGVFVCVTFAYTFFCFIIDYSFVNAFSACSILLALVAILGFVFTWCADGTILQEVAWSTDTLSLKVDPVFCSIALSTLSS
jgi:hypothetical protein